MELSKIFEDENLRYYVHGTGRLGNDSDNSITNSIFENGLLMYTGTHGYNNGSLDLKSTAYPIGDGSSSLYNEVGYSALHQNPHLESKRIIIIALPKDYIFPEWYCFGEMREAAFTDEKKFFTSKEDEYTYQSNNIEDIPSNKVLMSEFIVGAYDATTQTFIPNEKYFKNTNKSTREDIFQKVHNNYIQYLKQQIKNVTLNGIAPFSIEDYLSLFEDNNCKIPLLPEEISDLKEFSLEVLRQKEVQKMAASDSNVDEDFFGWDGM